jgi:hypothetical protein
MELVKFWVSVTERTRWKPNLFVNPGASIQ